MGIHRTVSVTCDGPCGKVVPESSTMPEDWAKITLSPFERLKQGEKPKLGMSAWLCPNCYAAVLLFLERSHYALSRATINREQASSITTRSDER